MIDCRVVLKHDWHAGAIVFNGQIGKKKVVVQVGSPTPLGLKLQHYGTQVSRYSFLLALVVLFFSKSQNNSLA